MKKLITVLIAACFVSFVHSQEDTSRYFKYPATYGVSYPRIWPTKVLRTPFSDTSALNAQPGAIQAGLDGKPYWWNGIKWEAFGGGGTWNASMLNDPNLYADHNTDMNNNMWIISNSKVFALSGTNHGDTYGVVAGGLSGSYLFKQGADNIFRYTRPGSMFVVNSTNGHQDNLDVYEDSTVLVPQSKNLHVYTDSVNDVDALAGFIGNRLYRVKKGAYTWNQSLLASPDVNFSPTSNFNGNAWNLNNIDFLNLYGNGFSFHNKTNPGQFIVYNNTTGGSGSGSMPNLLIYDTFGVNKFYLNGRSLIYNGQMLADNAYYPDISNNSAYRSGSMTFANGSDAVNFSTNGRVDINTAGTETHIGASVVTTPDYYSGWVGDKLVKVSGAATSIGNADSLGHLPASDYYLKAGGDLSAGAYLGLPALSSNPATPGSGARLFSDASGRLSWINQLGYTRTLRSRTLTGNRVYTFYDRDYTVADSADLASVAASIPVAANASGTIGLTAVNGSASTFMRSDATPALSQSITPTWTNQHTFSGNIVSSVGSNMTMYNLGNPSATDQEMMTMSWANNVFVIGNYQGGSGGVRSMRIGVSAGSGSTTISRRFNISSIAGSTAGIFDLDLNSSATAANLITMQGGLTGASGVQGVLGIIPTINQTSTAGYNALLISPFENTTGSGAKYLINAGTSSAASGGGSFTARFRVDNLGVGFISSKWGIGATTPASVFHVANGITQSVAFSDGGYGFRYDDATYVSTSSSGTIATAAAYSFGVPTFQSGASATLTNAASLYIKGAPSAGTNVTITNPYSVYVASGDAFFNSRVIAQGALQTSTAVTSSNFVASGGTSVGNTGSTLVNFGGSSTGANFRVMLTGSNSSTIGTNAVYSNFIAGSSPVTTAATGTHAVLANAVINPVGTITTGGAAVSETSTLYINGAATGGNNNYALHTTGATALSKFDGYVSINHLQGNSSTPSIAANTGAGTSPTISITGTDLSFKVTLTAGTSPSSGSDLFTVTFNSAYGGTPRVSVASANNSPDVSLYSTATATTYKLSTKTGAGLTAGQQYVWDITITQ